MCKDITVSVGVRVCHIEASRDSDDDGLVDLHAGVLDDRHLALPPLPLALLPCLDLVEVLLDVADVLLHVLAPLDLDACLVAAGNHRHLGDMDRALLLLLLHGVVGTGYRELGELRRVTGVEGQYGGALPRVVARWSRDTSMEGQPTPWTTVGRRRRQGRRRSRWRPS